MLSFLSRAALCASALLVVVGCGGKKTSGTPVYPVTGVVRVDGQPASQVLVVFHPAGEVPAQVTGPNAQTKPRPFAKTNPDGTFTITTHEPGDGAAVGNYKISLTWSPTEDEEETLGRADKFGGRFADPATSNLSFEVKAEPNTVPPIELPAIGNMPRSDF